MKFVVQSSVARQFPMIPYLTPQLDLNLNAMRYSIYGIKLLFLGRLVVGVITFETVVRMGTKKFLFNF
jgi:hypothetical protein